MPSPHAPLIVASGQGGISRLPLHRNAGLEIVYISRGHLHWQVEGRTENVFPHSVFFTFPWEEHGSLEEYEPGHLCHWVVLGMREVGGKLPRHAAFHWALGFSNTETERIRRVLDDTVSRSFRASHELSWILPKLVRECSGNDPLAKSAIPSLARLLLLELVRCIESDIRPGPILSGVETRMHACIRMLGERSSEPWTLETMSRVSRLSRTRFSELFKRITGDSPTHYLRRMRVRHAQELLRATERPVTEIALECGFETSQHFARIFRQFCKQTASEYRASHR